MNFILALQLMSLGVIFVNFTEKISGILLQSLRRVSCRYLRLTSGEMFGFELKSVLMVIT